MSVRRKGDDNLKKLARQELQDLTLLGLHLPAHRLIVPVGALRHVHQASWQSRSHRYVLNTI